MKLNKNVRDMMLVTALLGGVSLIPFMRNNINQGAAEFAKTQVVVANDTLSLQEFYNNLSYNSRWMIETKDGSKIPLDSVADFRFRDERNYAALQSVKLTNKVDTVRARYDSQDWKVAKSSDIICSLGSLDSLRYIPSLGLYSYDKIIIREFVADNPRLQKIVDNFNDKYACTYDHEYKHYLNALDGSGRAGQSYETRFVENCADEISANMAQLLAQKNNYFDNGKNLNFITPRFNFYTSAIAKGKISPEKNKITDEEKSIIANGVFDFWKKDQLPLYVERNTNRAIYSLGKTSYNGIKDDPEKSDELMKKMFLINGIDFYPFIKDRLPELREKIPEESKKKFLQQKQFKYRTMNYLEKLEHKRTEEGKSAYNEELLENKIKASLYNVFCRKNSMEK